MITLQNVSKKYGEQLAVDHLNLTINEGEICILLGKSGCGKSTTLKMINRLIEPTSGEIYVAGKKIHEYDIDSFRWNMGYAVQNVGLFPHMTVEHNIAIVPQMLKWDKEKIHSRVEEMLNLVGLDIDKYIRKYPAELSGGEAQRVGVARALAADPQIVLMDEPFGALDPINRVRLQNEFLKIQKYLHKTVVFVTHDIEEAIRLGDRIAIMEQGVLKAYESPHKLLSENTSDFVKEFIGKDYMLKLLSRFKVSECVINNFSNDNPCESSIFESDNLQSALAMMLQNSVIAMTVIDKDGHPTGQISIDAIFNKIKEEQNNYEK